MYHVGLIWQLRFIFRHAVDFRSRGYQHRNMSPRDGHCKKLKIQQPASEKKKEKRKKKENKTRGVLGAGQNQASGHLEPPKAFAQLCAMQSSRMVCVYAVGPRPVPLAPLCQATCPVRLAAITNLQSIVLQNSIYVPRLAYC